ncbi:hypothetical protein GCM10010518_57520 [Kitasatospora cinereorecta]
MDAGARARDWAEIQERMLAPLYEAVFERLEVGAGTRMLSIGCGSGLALLIAASRGARVTGCETDRERLALARERLASGPGREGGGGAVRTGDTRGGCPVGGGRGRGGAVQPAHRVQSDRLRGG